MSTSMTRLNSGQLTPSILQVVVSLPIARLLLAEEREACSSAILSNIHPKLDIHLTSTADIEVVTYDRFRYY